MALIHQTDHNLLLNICHVKQFFKIQFKQTLPFCVSFFVCCICICTNSRLSKNNLDLLNVEWYQQMKKDMASYGRMAFLKDGSEEAEKLMASMRTKLDEAPISTKFINQKIRMPGFVVPLDAVRNGQREFLLVPYFGACIHTPPPPANQIVLVTPSPKLNLSKPLESMDVIWIEGELKEARTKTASGVSGYTLEAVQIYPYTALHNTKK
jgi:hypothetical protein